MNIHQLCYRHHSVQQQSQLLQSSQLHLHLARGLLGGVQLGLTSYGVSRQPAHNKWSVLLANFS
jgi:hypothetical protein